MSSTKDYEAQVICDSISPDGHRLTTFLVCFPRFILAELNTHRMLSRNSASSRAIPVLKRIEAVQENPFVPLAFSKNQKGMQASENIDESDRWNAEQVWGEAADDMIGHAGRLSALGVHKQHANRLLETFAWHTAIVSATDWENFFALRCHPAAQPEFRTIAEMMKAEYEGSTPVRTGYDQWHLPMVLKQELWNGSQDIDGPVIVDEIAIPQAAQLVSAGRCARVSYLTHAGERSPREDVELAGRLRESGHMSPFEHPARPMTDYELECFKTYTWSENGPVLIGSYLGNFNGWVSLRKVLPNERVFKGGSL